MGAVESDPEDPGFTLGATVDELQMQQVGARADWTVCVLGGDGAARSRLWYFGTRTRA